MRVVAAAIKDGDVICSLARPKRHHDIIAAMIESGRPAPITGTQGFILDDGTFVTRELGYEVARTARQIKKKHGPDGVLFSEDMW